MQLRKITTIKQLKEKIYEKSMIYLLLTRFQWDAN